MRQDGERLVALILASISAGVVAWFLVAGFLNRPTVDTNDWLVFEKDNGGKLKQGYFSTMQAEGDGFHCWMVFGRKDARPDQEGVWRSPVGILLPLPTTASRLRVHGGRWAETAAMVGINIRDCR